MVTEKKVNDTSLEQNSYPQDGLYLYSDGRKRLAAGADKICKAVKVTLGGRGDNVVIKVGQHPVVTKDGVTVANSIVLSDTVEEMGASLIKEATRKVSIEGGDGTTTATVIANKVITEGMKAADKYNPIFVKRGMEKALGLAIESINNNTKEVSTSKEVEQVATISANNDTVIGDVIASAIRQAGKEGLVTIRGGSNLEDSIEITDGIEIGAGWANPNMITNPQTHQAIFKRPFILMFTGRISEWKQISPIMNQVLAYNNKFGTSRGVIVMAEKIEEQALNTLVINHVNGTLPCVAIEAPGVNDNMRDILEDIALVTNSTLYKADVTCSLEDALLDELGTCEQITVGKDITEIISDPELANNEELQTEIKNRIISIKAEIELEQQAHIVHVLRSRLAKLAGKIAVISVGGSSDIDRAERSARMTDALHAARAAIADGIVHGGGITLLLAHKALSEVKVDDADDVKSGFAIVLDALLEPMRVILHNAKFSEAEIEEKISQAMKEADGFGYDVYKLISVDNMIEAGIIDPAKVTITALETAISIASTITSVSCVSSR